MLTRYMPVLIITRWLHQQKIFRRRFTHLKIGLQIMRFNWPNQIGPRLAEIAKLADETNFASLWVMDHFFQIGGEFGNADEPMLEGYSTITYCAALTQQIRLGVLVTGNLYHYPGLLIKRVTTLDVLSGGRAYFGIGAGWYEREARGLGVPYPNLNERFARLEETLRVAKHMWAGEQNPYHGTFYQLEEPINCPPSLQQPHPPILIGGEGENKTLGLVAKYGDACNLYAGGNTDEYAEGIQSIRRKLARLQQHCDAVGRSYSEIERTALAGVQMTEGPGKINEMVALCRSLAEVGIQHVIFNMPQGYERRSVEIIGKEIIPRVAEFSS
jgi:F420-dependent oxidoreductase-like protein